MTELIRQYEKDIELIRGRIKELKTEAGSVTNADNEGSLRDRIELLQTEMYEMMYETAVMRRKTEPKPITPSMAARMAAAGDAAC